MLKVIESAKSKIKANGGLKVLELGVLAVENNLPFRFCVELLEAERVIPPGTYALISADLTDSYIMSAAEHCMHPTNGGLSQADNLSTPAAICG